MQGWGKGKVFEGFGGHSQRSLENQTFQWLDFDLQGQTIFLHDYKAIRKEAA